MTVGSKQVGSRLKYEPGMESACLPLLPSYLIREQPAKLDIHAQQLCLLSFPQQIRISKKTFLNYLTNVTVYLSLKMWYIVSLACLP